MLVYCTQMFLAASVCMYSHIYWFLLRGYANELRSEFVEAQRYGDVLFLVSDARCRWFQLEYGIITDREAQFDAPQKGHAIRYLFPLIAATSRTIRNPYSSTYLGDKLVTLSCLLFFFYNIKEYGPTPISEANNLQRSKPLDRLPK
jgi:hypothetical protein